MLLGQDDYRLCKKGHHAFKGRPCVQCVRNRAHEQSVRRKAKRGLEGYAKELLELETALMLAPPQFPQITIDLRAQYAIKLAAFEEICGSSVKAQEILGKLRSARPELVPYIFQNNP